MSERLTPLLAALAPVPGLLHGCDPHSSAPCTGERTLSVAAAWRCPPGATEEERLAEWLARFFPS